jgi:hypothetical protein
MEQRSPRWPSPAPILPLLLCALLAACSDDGEGSDGPSGSCGTRSFMEAAKADCEFSILTFQVGSASPIEVDINGLAVEEMDGAQKSSSGDGSWEFTRRRGVRMSAILQKAGVTAGEDAPVNCVARDGYDPLRTRLQGDVLKLPRFAFVRDDGYVHLGSPGDKDPLYPDMEGKSLFMDYDLASDAEVPEELGTEISSLSAFRWKMMEKVDPHQRGTIEIDPVP